MWGGGEQNKQDADIYLLGKTKNWLLANSGFSLVGLVGMTLLALTTFSWWSTYRQFFLSLLNFFLLYYLPSLMDLIQTVKDSFKLNLLWILWLVSMCQVCEVKRHTWCNPVWVSLILWLWLRLLCWNCLSILGNLRAGGEKERTIVRQPPGVSRHHVHNERCPPVQIKNTQFSYQCRATGSGLIPCQIFVTMACRFGLYQF